MKFRIAFLACVMTAGAVAAGPPPQAPAEDLPAVVLRPFYGDAENVSLLAGLLGDEDSLVREQAVRDLGQTHNALALPHVLAAMADKDLTVRQAALSALAELDAARHAAAAAEALSAQEPAMLLTALEAVRRGTISSAAPQVKKLANSENAAVAASAIQTMTKLGLPLDAATVKALLGSASPTVRLRAAENAVLTAAGGELRDILLNLAENDPSPAVRGAAVAAGGKVDFAGFSATISQAQRSGEVLVRRGAVLACRYAGRGDRLNEFLKDESSPVRLAAIQAAGELRCGDCVPKLLELLWQAQEDVSHQAALEGLERISDPRIDAAAAQVIEEGAKDLKEPIRGRNVRSACCLLGAHKSAAGLDRQLALLGELPVESPVLIDLARSLGRIGDARALAPLTAKMEACAAAGRNYLRAYQAPNPPSVMPAYSEEAASELVLAVGQFKEASTQALLRIATSKVQKGRLYGPAVAAMRVLPGLAGEANLSAIEAGIMDLLSDAAYDTIIDRGGMICLARLQAARAAVKLRVKSAAPALQAAMVGSPLPIAPAARWALAELTGKLPPPAQPEVLPGEWIVRKAQK